MWYEDLDTSATVRRDNGQTVEVLHECLQASYSGGGAPQRLAASGPREAGLTMPYDRDASYDWILNDWQFQLDLLYAEVEEIKVTLAPDELGEDVSARPRRSELYESFCHSLASALENPDTFSRVEVIEVVVGERRSIKVKPDLGEYERKLVEKAVEGTLAYVYRYGDWRYPWD